MAQLLINTRTHRVVTVQPDLHQWGRMESKQAWLASGGLEQDWPSDFVVLRIPGVPVASVSGSQFDDSLLTPEQLTALEADGELTLEPWQLALMVR